LLQEKGPSLYNKGERERERKGLEKQRNRKKKNERTEKCHFK